MDPKILKKVISQIHSRFPEFSGCQPKVRQQNSQAVPSAAVPTYLLTFQNTGQVSSQGETRRLPRSMRVVVSEQGTIVKISTSR